MLGATMYRKTALIGGTAAAIVGIGTAAMATSGTGTNGSPTTAVTDAASSSTGSASANAAALAKFAKRHPLLAKALAHHLVHGQIVTKNGTGYVTHDGIIGDVTAVNATSISVKASDGYSLTFSVGSSTKVRMRVDGEGSASTIAAVHTGDTVAVIGTGTTSPAATLIVDAKG
jgi:hypothetical protein